MSVRRVIIGCVAAVATGVIALSAQAVAPRYKPSPAFERAFLGEMDAPTRAKVAKRATGGNSISGVIAVILLNDHQMSKHAKPGQAVSIVAIDFIRGIVVVKNGPDHYEPVHFDPKTLNVVD